MKDPIIYEWFIKSCWHITVKQSPTICLKAKHDILEEEFAFKTWAVLFYSLEVRGQG